MSCGQLPVILLFLTGTPGARVSPAAGLCHGDCAIEPDCWLAEVDCLLAAELPREAIERLKPLVSAHPQVTSLALLLSRAYLADNNPFWAQRALYTAAAASDDCSLHAWLAWLQINGGDLETARATLADAECDKHPPDDARWHLLEAYALRLEQRGDAAAGHIASFAEAPTVYREDRELWQSLRARDDPSFVAPLRLDLEAHGGYTSNGLAGSPADPGVVGSDSGLGRLHLFGRFVLPTWPAVRPVLEAGLKGHGLAPGVAASMSYLELSTRPGLLLRRDYPRVFIGYRGDLLLLNKEDQRAFYEGHRVEVEIEIDDHLTALAGGGYRLFHEAGRSRGEVDGAVGWGRAQGRRGHLLLAGALRVYDAMGDPYDLVGASLLAAIRVRVFEEAYVRFGTTVGVDSYFNSGGELGLLAHGARHQRVDITARFTAGLWSPAFYDLRVGIRYELGLRSSTADRGFDKYGYTEHRALLGFKWSADFDPWAPAVARVAGHLGLDYGAGAARVGVGEEERIQDLLRQDEAARRGSSCVN